MLNSIKSLLEKLFNKNNLLPIYKGIKKRQRRSCQRSDLAKYGDPLSKYNKYN